MACTVSCGGTQDSFANCEPETKQSNGVRLVGYTCDTTFVDITDPAEWTTLFGTSKAFYSSEGLLTKPLGSPNLVRTSATKQKVSNVSNTPSFKSYDFDATATLDYAFWNSLQGDDGVLIVGWLDADDRFYPMLDASVFAGTDWPESAPGELVSWNAQFTYDSIGEIVPVLIPGLNAAIDALV